MARRITITSTSNPRLKSARRLARGRARGAGTFLAEGHRQVRCALDSHAVVRELFAAPELFLGRADHELVALAERRGTQVYELGRDAFTAICGNARPDGLIAVVERWPTSLQRLPPPRGSLLLVADSIERPGNLGTIIRTACAAGAAAAIVSDPVTDLFHPDTVRGSAGALFKLPLATAATTAAVSWLRTHGVRIAVASPAGAVPHWEADAQGNVAVVVGSERHGVGTRWLAAADEVVAIPMPGPADSVNVAVAAGVVLFDIARRR